MIVQLVLIKLVLFMLGLLLQLLMEILVTLMLRLLLMVGMLKMTIHICTRPTHSI